MGMNDNVLISKGVISGNGGNGLAVMAGQDFTLIDCEVGNNQRHGIYLGQEVDNVKMVKSVIAGNGFKDGSLRGYGVLSNTESLCLADCDVSLNALGNVYI